MGFPVVSGVMTGTTVITSNPTNIENHDNVGLQIAWTGTPVGLLEVLCSIDGKTYFALTFDPELTQPAGAAGGYLINLNQLPFTWLKIQYTNASGSGALTAFISGKDVN